MNEFACRTTMDMSIVAHVGRIGRSACGCCAKRICLADVDDFAGGQFVGRRVKTDDGFFLVKFGPSNKLDRQLRPAELSFLVSKTRAKSNNSSSSCNFDVERMQIREFDLDIFASRFCIVEHFEPAFQ